MAVIVRENQEFDGEIAKVKVYRTEGLLTKEEKVRAEALDEVIQRRMGELIAELEKTGLIDRVGGNDTLELWYTVGKGLDFVDDPHLVSPSDEKYVWRAIYDHAGPLHAGTIPKRARERPLTSHFRYCYLLGKFDWEFVESGGTWTTWSEFFDSKPIREDNRIIAWLGRIQDRRTEGLQNWIRPLNRAIRNEFRDMDTGVFNDRELKEKLEAVYRRVYGESSPTELNS